MSVSSELAKLGSGVGRIYLTDSSDVLTGYEFINDARGRENAERLMLVSSTLSSSISATSIVQVTAAGGDITNLSYNGVSVFDVVSPVTGATTEDLAINLATAINAHVSSPEYTAVASGSNVTVYLAASEGSSLNGTTAAFSTTGTATMSATDLDGGSYSTQEVDSQIGYKMYINASATAPSLDLTGATDITSGVLRKSSSSPYSIREVELVSGSASIARDGAVTVANIQTEGAIAADDLTSIDAGIFADGDTLLIRGKEASKVTTVKEGGNIELSNNSDFLTGEKDFVLELQYSISDNKWYEISRSPGNDLSVSSLRSSGIAVPVQGVLNISLATTGGVIPLEAGVSQGVYILAGTGTLTGSWSFTSTGTPLDGDTFIFDYNATFTASGNTISFFGVSLTDDQALSGSVLVKAIYNSAFATWRVSVLEDITGVDLATTTDLAAKEDDLGLPASDGQVLTSTTGGVRTWVSNATDIALDGNATTSSSSAGIETTLRTITIPAATLSSNGSAVVVKYSGQFGSNANAKAFKAKFNGT